MSCSRKLILCATFAAAVAHGAAPTLDHLYPVALVRGSTNAVQAVGKYEPWPPKVWVDVPGIVFRPETNNGKFMVEVSPEVPAGAHLVRGFNESGASAPRFLVVTEGRLTSEREPNDDRQKPQAIEGSSAEVNGRLDKTGDVDCYQVALRRGQTLFASLECFTLKSPVDAVLRLVDSRGVEVAFNHDDGRTFDPELSFTASADGAYVLQVFGFAYPADAAIRFTGNDKCVYLLRTAIDADRRCPLASVSREIEPNNSPDQAATLRVSEAIAGCIDTPDDQDCFGFDAKKGEKLKLEVESASLGFPLDSWLKIVDKSGKELIRKDDDNSPDPILEWTAPEDGKYVAAIGNLLYRGGSNYLYRFSIEKTTPAIAPSVTEHAFVAEVGKTNSFKISLGRVHGHSGRIKAQVIGVPETVAVEVEETSETAGEVVLRLAPKPEAKGFGGPIRIVVTEQNGFEQPALYRMTSRGEDNGVPQGHSKLLIDATEHLWLTVK